MIQYVSPFSVLRVDYTLKPPLYPDKISKLFGSEWKTNIDIAYKKSKNCKR